MYSTLLITHQVIVTLFLLHYALKLALLLGNKSDALAKYTKATRVIEMILSVGFLGTGIWLLATGSGITTMLTIKLLCIVAAIPLAIIGFRKKNKALATLSVFLIVMSYGLAEMNRKHKTGGKIDTSTTTDPITAGKLIYSNSCVSCHGSDGKLGLSGAKDLSVTTLTKEEQRDNIRNGKNAMPAYKDLTDEQVSDVIQYIATLKQ